MSSKCYKKQDVNRYCQRHNVTLTPLRQSIMDVLVKEKKPLTAYAVLAVLKETRPNAQVMSVYRVLNFLVDNGLVHRIENLNAFVACHHLSCEHGDERHFSQWLICEKCGDVEECIVSDFQQGLEQISAQTGFAVSTPMIELLGVCRNCQQSDSEESL